MHIWTIENWVKILDYDNITYRTGLRLRFDENVDGELRSACKHFATWMRKEYFFPIRIPIYLKNKRKLRCIDGDLAYGTFFEPTSYKDEPYIRIAVGDFCESCQKFGKENAILSVLEIISHELTHYFQWINELELTSIGKERQATMYARYIVSEYVEWIHNAKRE